MKFLTWQNPEQLFVAQELINKVKSKCCGIKDNMRKQYHVMDSQMFQNLKNKVGLFTSLQKLFVCIDELSFFNIKNILSEMEGHYEIFLLMSI